MGINFKGIRLKLIIMYISLVFIVMVASGTLMLIGVRRADESASELQLREDAKLVIDNIIADGGNPEQFQDGFDKLGTSVGYASIVDSRGRTIATTTETSSDDFTDYALDVVTAALAGSEQFDAWNRRKNKNGVDTTWMEFAKPVFGEDGRTRFVVYVALDANRIVDDLDNIANIIMLAMGFAILLAGGIGFAFSGTLTGPIRLLTQRSKELAEGDLSNEIAVKSNDEIGQLARSFNYMAKELSSNIKSIENEKNKMEIVLFNMTDGVMAYDGTGVLIHVNQVARELMDMKDIQDAALSEMLAILYPDVAFGEDVFQSLDSLTETTFTVKDRFIGANVNSYRDADGTMEGVIIVLQDITKHMRLDNMRKEFVANVSHEMRTPLTTIKSYAETLQDGAMEDRETALEFLGIIGDEVDRMTLIVHDLLELSSLDNNQLAMNIHEVDLTELVRQNARRHSLTAERQNKTIVLDEPPYEMPINADPQRISQVLTNIISNSIKYSPPGATINVYADRNEKYYKVYVRDNGFGIPKEDLRRIFERFYRVDKARSREMGGTGLGLSIAKEIMEIHGGGIYASSEAGKGTTMILRFPRI